MHLSRISIENFKSIPPRGIHLQLSEGVTVLLGKNNAGKSNILEAVDVMLGSKNPVYRGYGDNQYHDIEKPIRITLEFADLSFGDGRQVGLSEKQAGMLMSKSTKRTHRSPGHMTFELTIPPLMGDDEASESRSLIIYLANDHEVRRTEDIRKVTARYLNVPAVRKRDDLLKPSTWTSYGRFLSELVSESERSEDLSRMIKEITSKLQDVLSDEMDELTKAGKLTAYVDQIFFRLTKGGEPAELLRNLSIGVEFGGRVDDLSDVGTGTQSAVILAILELCLRNAKIAGPKIFAVEEPENYLHPQSQRYVAKLLDRIGDESRSQVVVTTHSPNILEGVSCFDVVKVGRSRDDAGTVCLRVNPTFSDIDPRIEVLSFQTAEMLFADRIVLVEGPSEKELLSSIAPHISDSEGKSCDPDRLNASIVDVGGKENFDDYVQLLDAFDISWRILADNDALVGDTLTYFKSKYFIDASADLETQRRELKEHGVGVLSNGEIEDYYPDAALAHLAGCDESDVTTEISRRRKGYDDPSVFQIVSAVIQDNHPEIVAAAPERQGKLMQGWYHKSLERLRASGAISLEDRKAGEIISQWLKMPKPGIARRVAMWMLSKDGHIPESLQHLTIWLFQPE